MCWIVREVYVVGNIVRVLIYDGQLISTKEVSKSRTALIQLVLYSLTQLTGRRREAGELLARIKKRMSQPGIRIQ